MKNNRIIKTFESFTKNNFIKESNEYETQMAKDKVDDDFIQWISREFGLKPETIIAMTDISNDSQEVYNMVDNETNSKGYGFDQVEEEKEEEFINEYIVRISDETVNGLKYKGNIFNLKSLIEKHHLSTSFGENHKYLDIELGYIGEYAQQDYDLLKEFLNEKTNLSKEDVDKIMSDKFILSIRYEYGVHKEEKIKEVSSFDKDLDYDSNILF